MKKWQWVGVNYGGDGLKIFGTHAPTLEWLGGEVQRRFPKARIEKMLDADDVVHRITAKLKFNESDSVESVLKRLLCEDGWEPFQTGVTFKRAVEE